MPRGRSATLRILFLTQTYPRWPGDTAGPFIRELARGLVRAGDRVTVLTPRAAQVRRAWTDDGVEVCSFAYAPRPLEVLGYGRSLAADEHVRPGAALAAPLYLLAAARAVARHLGRERHDLLHAHWVAPNGLVALWPGVHGKGTLIAAGLHGSDVFLAEKALARPAIRRALARCDLLTGCSPELVERVRRIGYRGKPSRVIPYGVDTDMFRPLAELPGEPVEESWRERLNIPDNSTVLLGVGRLATKKGFQVLIDVLPRLLSDFSDLHTIIAGDGDQMAHFRATVDGWRPDHTGRIHLPGAVAHDDLPGLYRGADLFVLPAVHDPQGNVDGLPNVILEALASGLPVVATSVSGIPLAVESGVQGVLVPEQDRAALREAIAGILGNPEQRRLMGARARSRAVSQLTWDIVAGRYRQAYLDALADGGRR
ncbi:MAG: glycosyltransferase family 4 protein [Holophagales bacterium]|nr:glycosyltransferase family 4 protein [Holophagales bacterium]MYD20626.1 glycosyltransferase family 4 protein [Holophagales bacterium]MYI34244.1 glycosyltransferase family 4 protein [Holophagales bacterium]